LCVVWILGLDNNQKSFTIRFQREASCSNFLKVAVIKVYLTDDSYDHDNDVVEEYITYVKVKESQNNSENQHSIEHRDLDNVITSIMANDVDIEEELLEYDLDINADDEEYQGDEEGDNSDDDDCNVGDNDNTNNVKSKFLL